MVLWSPSVLCPTPRMRLTEADRSGGIKPDHTLLATGNVRPDTTGPACLGKPRIRGVGPRTQHPYGEKDPPNRVVGSGCTEADTHVGAALRDRP